MSIKTKTLIAAALFASIGTVSTATVAGEVRTNERGERMIYIDHTHLNLNTAAGQRALEARINQAAKKVCGVNSGYVPLQEASMGRACLKTSTVQAKADMALALKKQGSGYVAVRANTNSTQ